MVKRLIYSVLFVFISCAAFAQSYNMNHIIQRVNAQADLTESQRADILKLSSEYYPRASKIQNSKSSDEAKFVKALALKKEFDIDLKKILNSAQYKKYQSMCDAYEKRYRNQIKRR